MPPFKYNLRHIREKAPYSATPHLSPSASAHEFSEDGGMGGVQVVHNNNSPILASQSSSPTPYPAAPFFPTHHVAHTPHTTHPSALYTSVHGPVVDSAVPDITADLDALSLSGPPLSGVAPEDTFITVPGDQIALVVAIIIDLAVRYATRIGGRWLCPFTDCPQVHVGSKDSLKHHLHRIHYRPSKRLHCPVDWCDRHFGYYLDLNRHHSQVHLGVGHVCPCTGRWYPRLETLKKRCRRGSNCPGAIDRRAASPGV
ncbi:hypothetical protein BGZ82_002223 [Podila clonocystis]|nr:hypothetical protein BGZ82_002223 [Podila clonocystis]